VSAGRNEALGTHCLIQGETGGACWILTSDFPLAVIAADPNRSIDASQRIQPSPIFGTGDPCLSPKLFALAGGTSDDRLVNRDADRSSPGNLEGHLAHHALR
jgi:hypothetical protein